jgi:uncharacterized membrane protein
MDRFKIWFILCTLLAVASAANFGEYFSICFFINSNIDQSNRGVFRRVCLSIIQTQESRIIDFDL